MEALKFSSKRISQVHRAKGQQSWSFRLHGYFLLNYVLSPYLVVDTVHRGRNPGDVEDEDLALNESWYR